MEKKLPWILIALLTLIYGVAIFAKDYYIADWFRTDDAFYYFKIADNITSRVGSTFDGISKTNGYHPLWLILLLPVFLFSDSNQYISLRIVVLLQYLLSAGLVLITYNHLRQRITAYSSFIITLLWILYFPLFTTLTNGTEALINAFSLTVFWVIFNHNISQSPRVINYQGVMQIGFTALLVIFSRLDNIFLLVVFGAWLGLLYISDSNWKMTWKTVVELIKLEIVYFGPTTILVGIYLLINKIVIGTFMPISGQVKRYWGTLPYTTYGGRVNGIGSFIGEFFSEDMNIGPFSLLLDPIYSQMDKLKVSYLFGTRSFSFGLIIVFGVFFLTGYLFGRKEKLAFHLIEKWSIFPLALSSILQISYYKIVGYLASRSWYWITESFLILLFLGVILEALFKSLQNGKRAPCKIVPIALTLSLTVLILVPHARQIFDQLTSRVDSQHLYIQKALWLEENTEDGSIIGMTGAGTTSYFVEGRVIMNLDGLVNGPEYFQYLQYNRAVDFLVEHHVKYIFGNEYLMLETEPYKSNFQEILNGSEIMNTFNGKLVLWKLHY